MGQTLSTFPGWFRNIFNTNEENIQNVSKNFIRMVNSEMSQSQNQTANSFAYQWSRRDLFDQPNAHYQVNKWLIEKFGNPELWLQEKSIVLDAGCGGGQSILDYFGKERIKNISYIGCDVSSAAETAKTRFEEEKIENAIFVQSDLNKIPLLSESVDMIFSEGVLHHTDNARKSFEYLSRLLKKNGLFIFYVYKKKAPIREFADDFIRDSLKELEPEQKFSKLLSLTKLGKLLGDIDVNIKIDDPVDILGIPAGMINIQRLFFYYIFKCFYKSDWSLEQMNLTNFDWYSPQNCSRHTADEVRSWLSDNSFVIEREYVDDSGLSYVARKK